MLPVFPVFSSLIQSFSVLSSWGRPGGRITAAFMLISKCLKVSISRTETLTEIRQNRVVWKNSGRPYRLLTMCVHSNSYTVGTQTFIYRPVRVLEAGFRVQVVINCGQEQGGRVQHVVKGM